MGCAQASDANDDNTNPRSIATQGDGAEPTESDHSGEDCRSTQNAPKQLRGGTRPTVADGSPPVACRPAGPLSPRTAPCSTDGVPADDEAPPPQHTPPANLKVWRCYYMVNGAKFPVANAPQPQQQQVGQHQPMHVFPSTPPLQPHPTTSTAHATPGPHAPLMLPAHRPHAVPTDDGDDGNNDDDRREEKEAPSAPLLHPSLPSVVQQAPLCPSPEKRPSPDKRPTPEKYTIVQPCAPRLGSSPSVGGPGTSTAMLPYFHETNELLFGGGGGGGQTANTNSFNSIGEHYLLIESFTEEEEPMPDGGSDLTPLAGMNRGSGDLDESHHRLLDAFPEGFICTTPEPPSTLNDDDVTPPPPPLNHQQQHPSALARRTASGTSARNSGGGSTHHHNHHNHHGSPRRQHPSRNTDQQMPHFRPLVSNMSGGSFTTTAGSTGGGASASDGDCSASYVCRVSRSLPTDGEFVVRKKRR